MSHPPSELIAVDPDFIRDDDSSYDTSSEITDTTSLASSVHNYVVENGRHYHAYFGAEKNVMPVDETEKDRLDLHNEVFLLLLGGELYTAPLNNPQRVLDIGTGTGIWAIDMADKHPAAEVRGVDLSPIQPRWVPPNCVFEVDDVELPWTYPKNHFDFVHIRNLAQGIKDWPKLMSQVYKHTKPGGYVELADLGAVAYSDDNSMPDNNPIKIYLELVSKAMTQIGLPPATNTSMREHLQKAGFEDIHVTNLKQPLGPWPKDKGLKQVGTMVLLNCETAFDAYGLAAFTRILKMDPEEAKIICRVGYESAKNRGVHVYNYFYHVYGRKPLDVEDE